MITRRMEITEDLGRLREQLRLASLPIIAGRIRVARMESGLSHDRLGELMGGVTRQHLIKLEQGKHRPRAEMLERLATATGKPVDWFLAEEPVSPFRDAA